MASAHSKAATVPANHRSGVESPEVKERRRKLIAAINASQNRDAEEAEAALTQHLDDVYPETRLSDQ